MKTILLIFGFITFMSSAYADMLGINVELTRTNQGPTWQTLVSIQAGYLSNYNRVNVTVNLRQRIYGTCYLISMASSPVIHSKDTIRLGRLGSDF